MVRDAEVDDVDDGVRVAFVEDVEEKDVEGEKVPDPLAERGFTLGFGVADSDAAVDCVAAMLGDGGVSPQQSTLSSERTAHDHVSPQLMDTNTPVVGTPDTCP